MASIISDEDSSDSNFSEKSIANMFHSLISDSRAELKCRIENNEKISIVNKLFNRQLYGRFTKNSKSKTERAFNSIHWKCRFMLNQLIKPHALNHIFMGFTLCGNFFVSYKETCVEAEFIPNIEYELYVWRFSPGKMLQFISKHRIFKLYKGSVELEDITFMQYPTDPYKLLCYGVAVTNPIMAFITILTLPITDNCKYCNLNVQAILSEDITCGWCIKHGFILHFMFSMMQPAPKFEPNISLSYPDHLVFNTGHYIHILKVSNYALYPNTATTLFSHPVVSATIKDEEKNSNFNDTLSEISEPASDNISTNSVIEAIIDDFSEYDLDGADGNKPFHELNISCEPLNVTGKSYHNAMVQNITDHRLKRLQNNNKDCIFSIPQTSNASINSSINNSQKSTEKSKIDKKIAEKTYEFIEENEKCEKLSSFRKKRLAEKKYEFSEDNLENIVPFNSLRKERRYLYRSQNRCIRSPDFTANAAVFLSPRSSRSPMQSPNSRNNGQFSPGSVRNNIYCPSINRTILPHHSKNSTISPRETARKINVYSPTVDSDCSDSDSKLILRQINNHSTSQYNERKLSQHVGLLIVDSIRDESSKLIKKLVRRFSSVDFETSSLVSGQSRDDYNIPIEIPILVQTLTDQQLDNVPEFNIGNTSETQIIVSQRTFDCEQFVQRRAQKLCMETNLEFLHCEDYDIKLLRVCPLNGEIFCQAVIKLVALHLNEAPPKPETYLSDCFFKWDINTDAFEVIDPPEELKLTRPSPNNWNDDIDIEQVHSKQPVIMKVDSEFSKSCLRDYNENYEIYLKDTSYCDQRYYYYSSSESY